MAKIKTYKDLLNNLSEPEVKLFLLQLLQKDRTLQTKFLLQFSDQSADSLGSYNQLISNIIKSVPAYRGFRTTPKTNLLASKLRIVKVQFDKLYHEQNYLDAFNICKAFLNKVPPQIERSDDSSGSLQDVIYTFQDNLVQLYPSINAYKLKDDIVKYIFKTIEKYVDSDLNLSWNFCDQMQLSLTGDHGIQFYEFLIALESKISTPFQKEQIVRRIAKHKLSRNAADLEEYLKANLHYREVRILYIDQLINKGELDTARKEITLAKNQISKKYEYYNLADFDEREERILVMEGKSALVAKKLINEYLGLSSHDERRWQRLRAIVSKEEWTHVRLEIVQSIQDDQTRHEFNKFRMIIDIWFSDGDKDAAFEVFEKNKDLNLGFVYFFDFYKEDRFDECLPILRKQLMDWADTNGRNKYRSLAKFLSSVTNKPTGKIFVKNIVMDILELHPFKTALRDELIKFV